MIALNIVPFVRRGSHVIIVMYGYSGCGKTFSALLMAAGLAGPSGKIGFIETEIGRGAQTYAGDPGIPELIYGELTAPYTPERYIEAVKEMEEAGCAVLIIDSGSHLWEGVREAAEQTGHQGLVKWAGPKTRYQKYVKALLASKMHLIICLRAKEKLAQEDVTDPRTGQKTKRIVSKGMVPIQEKSFIYESTVQLYLHHESDEVRGTCTVERAPGSLLAAFPAGKKINFHTGETIRKWVESGIPVDHEFEQLRRQGEEAAAKGTKAFREWWASAPVKPKRDSLKQFLGNFQSIAATADAAAAEAEANAKAAAENPEGKEGDVWQT